MAPPALPASVLRLGLLRRLGFWKQIAQPQISLQAEKHRSALPAYEKKVNGTNTRQQKTGSCRKEVATRERGTFSPGNHRNARGAQFIFRTLASGGRPLQKTIKGHGRLCSIRGEPPVPDAAEILDGCGPFSQPCHQLKQ